jgi:hypothetical protein
VAVSQSRNHCHTGHLPLAGADNYLGIVPLRASTCDGVRVRGLCMNPFTLVGAGLQPKPVESTSMSGSRAEIRPDSSLIPRREAAVRLSRCCAEATAPRYRTSPSSGLEQPRNCKHYGFWQVF